VRVVIAEDSALLREGLARLLGEHGLQVVGTAASLDETLEVVNRVRPDVALVDIRLPPTWTDEGIRAAELIRANPELATGVLVLSQYLDLTFAMRLLGSPGGVGYLLKDSIIGSLELTDVLTRIARGGSVVDPVLVSALVHATMRDDPLTRLTDRERQILALMAEGRSNAGVAKILTVTEKTVEFHVSSIFSKLGLEPSDGDHRRVLAVLAYLDSRTGVTSDPASLRGRQAT
jgi:DNA-binding NarL/FixJ family response regulator